MSQVSNFLPFPPGFRFGSSVSSFQVEGNSGVRKSDWDVFLHQHQNIIRPGEVGPQWWKQGMAESDIDRMASLGMQVQRLSFEWARIEPEEGKVSSEALRRYREIIDSLREKHISPIITLNHYTLPEWVAKKGSWGNSEIIPWFENYVSLIAREFGDVSTWLTLNEPGILIESGYLLPFFPPQNVGLFSALSARRHMIKAHKRAYALLKKSIPGCLVSMAFAFRWYRPENPNDGIETLYANEVDYLDSLNYIDAVGDTIDFIGCNFYAGYFLNLNLSKVRFRLHGPQAKPPKTILFGEVRKPGAYISDLGAPIVPGFFLELLRTLHKRYRKPIIITENGIADRNDRHRAFYILTHLTALWRVLQEGVDVRQYLVWSSVDNLEWLEGYRQEFGLVHVNPVTGVRTIRKSAHLYKNIVVSRGIHIKMLLDTYFQGEEKEKAALLIHHLLNKHEKDAIKSTVLGI